MFLLLVKVSEDKVVTGERLETGGAARIYMELRRQGVEPRQPLSQARGIVFAPKMGIPHCLVLRVVPHPYFAS